MISRPKLAMASIAKIYGFLNHVYCDTCIFPHVLLKKKQRNSILISWLELCIFEIRANSTAQTDKCDAIVDHYFIEELLIE